MADAFEMPLSVMTDGGERHLLLRAAAPVPWAHAAPLVVAAAGLPSGTVLFHGWAPPAQKSSMGLPPLLAGLRLDTTPQPPPMVVGGLTVDCVAGPDAGVSMRLDGPAVIGRSPTADLTLADPEVSGRHARITVAGPHHGEGPLGTGPVLADLFSTNGIRPLGGPPPDDGTLPLTVGVPVRVGGSVLRMDLPAAPLLLREPDGRGQWSLTLPPRADTTFTAAVPRRPDPLPTAERRRIPVLTALLTAGVGIGIAAVTGLWMFLLMAVLGPVTMIAAALGDRASDRRPRRRAAADHRRDLDLYAAAVAAAVRADRADAWDRFADPARSIRWAQQGAVGLWQQPPVTHGDGFVVTLAVGRRPVRWAPTVAPPPADVDDVPLPHRLPAGGVIGVCGGGRGTVRWLLAQWLAGHPPSRLQMQIVGAAEDLTVLRDVPQVVIADPSTPTAFPPTPSPATAISGTTELRRIVVLDDVPARRTVPAIRRLLDHHDPDLLVVAISRARSGLPEQCTMVIDTDDLPGEPIGITPAVLDRLACALVPLTVAAGGAVPQSVIAEPADHRELERRWSVGTRAVAVLGIAAGGRPVEFDLDADGPHLLVAGTTGAGKSELLQTLIVGLAGALPPTRLTLLLIDYKGGAAFGAIARLPHTGGLVTDLEGRLAPRALHSLRAEIRCRERALNDAGAVDLASWVERDPVGAPPRLVIIVDEFAALAAELPDFLDGLVDIARRGRSLGLHLVLATQRPSGVVGPAITSNVAARICLRVTDPADSTDVIGSPAAAAIGAHTPGRAFLRTAGSAPVEFQTARVTAPSVDHVTVRSRDAPPAPDRGPVPVLALVDLAGAVAAGLPRPAPPWLPPLPERWEHPDPRVLGVLDLPDRQARASWPIPETSLLVAGPPASGRSTALRRWAAAVAAGGGRLSVVDSGGRTDPDGLGVAAAVDSSLDLGDPTLVLRLFTRFADELHRRRRRPGPPLGLIVDGWEPLVAVLDQLDYGQWLVGFCELVGRGPSVGIRVAVAGDLRLLQHRVAASFGSRLALGLPDVLGAPTAGLPPGRGSVDDGTEVQVARPDPAVGAVGAVGTVAAGDPGDVGDSGDRAVAAVGGVVVRPLPRMVRADQLPPPQPDLVPVGLGGDAAAAVGFDLTGAGGGLLVAASRRGGVSTALQVLLRGAAGAGVPAARLITRPQAAVPGVIDLHIDVGDPHRDRPLLEFLAGHAGPLLLVADDADQWVEDPVGSLLSRFLRLAGPGQQLVVGCRLDRALHSLRGLIAETAACRCGLLLGADAADGTLLDVTLPRRRSVPPPGRGHLIRDGVALPVQVARSGPGGSTS